MFLYTGHGDLWSNEVWPTLSAEQKAQRRQMFNSGEPGFGVSACEYFAERKIILTGGDTSAERRPAGWAKKKDTRCPATPRCKRVGVSGISRISISRR